MQPLHYLMTTGGLIWTAACVPAGIVLTWLVYRIINGIPAAWLCDYNETPSAELLSGQRVRYTGSGIIVSVLAAAALILCRLQFNKGYDIYFAAFVLLIMIALMIAVCDIKYTIIPDQFTIALAVVGLFISVYDLVRGYGILHTAWWSPLAGAALGGGLMLLIDLIGMLLYKRTGMGFGDVKLFAAVGLVTGFPGTILAVILSLMVGTVGFCVVLLIARFRSRSETKAADSGAAAPEGDVSAEAAEPSGTSEDNASDDREEAGGYLAFGPYIALALIAYVSLYDVIYYLVGLYLKLF